MQVYVTPEEVKQIKGAGEGGMMLLGFKPARWASAAAMACVAREGKKMRKRNQCSFPCRVFVYVDSCLPGS